MGDIATKVDKASNATPTTTEHAQSPDCWRQTRRCMTQ